MTALDVFTPPLNSVQIKKQEPKVSKIEAACSSKTADFIDSLMLEDETCDDDRRIAELLQAEFDLEHDEEIKRLEKNRNKSKYLNFTILCFSLTVLLFFFHKK